MKGKHLASIFAQDQSRSLVLRVRVMRARIACTCPKWLAQ